MASASKSRGLPIPLMLDPAFRLQRDPFAWVEDASRIQYLTQSDIRQYLERCKAEARKARRHGDLTESEEWSRKMEGAEGLLQLTPQQWSSAIINGTSNYFEWVPALHGLAAEGDSLAQNTFDTLVTDCTIRLVEMARGGSSHAVRLLAQLAHSFTKVINEIGTNQPELVAQTAQFLASWPVLDSPQPMMRGIRPNYQSIGLGAALPVRLEPSAKSPADNPAGRVAWPLLQHVVRLRQLGVRHAIKQGRFCELCEQSLQPQGDGVRPACSRCGFRLLPSESSSGGSGAIFSKCALCTESRSASRPKGVSSFQLVDFIDLPSLINEMMHPTGAISRYLKKRLSIETSHQCDLYLAARLYPESRDGGNQAAATISADDLPGWEYLADRFAAPNTSLDRWLVNQFSKATKKTLKHYHGAKADRPALRAELLKDLNRIIGGISISDAHCMTGVQLRVATKQLLSQHPEGADRVRLNRLLLEDAYPLAWLTTLTLLNAIAEEFNSLVHSPNFHKPHRFQAISLRPDTRSLLVQKPQGVALERLNRMLLEDAYPGHLSRSQTEKVCPLCELRFSDSQQRKETRAGFTLLDQATCLPELGTASLAEWWSVAKGCLIAGYPNKVVAGELDETASIFDGIVTAASHRKTPGDKRYRTLERLKERFWGYANSSHYGVKPAKKKSEVMPKP